MEASRTLRSWGAWVMVLWAWFAPGLALAEDVSPFRRRMERAGAQYEALEYEKALHWLTQARQVASTPDEQVEVALYRGLVLSDLGRRKQALEEFRAGLSLKPDAVLPAATGPKVERDFESVRKQVRRQQGTASAAAPPAKVEEPEAPAKTEVPPAVAVQETPAPAPVAPEPEPEAPQKKDLRSKLGAAGSTLGKNVGNALGSALDSVMGSKKKPEEPPPASPDVAKKDEP
ncbi:tetratricopeptide repeat protein [Myxococcus sp. AS-1-15]|uniref:tetratricopeptide repeat protein n=1 Tax=Myxococcus TaxID=32 RepID=UPI001CBFBC5B|nr:tetratricopeptide repeat protein [Myxococcus sp. AS-1-15]